MDARLPIPRAMLFDMDGTLTRPSLDFDAIRAEIGIAGPILEAMREMPDPARARAAAILDRHERAAAEASELNDGCDALLGWMAARGMPTALVTRNSRACVDVVLARHGLRFPVLIAREDGPPKPNPEPLWTACRRLGVSPADAWMIGDGSHDIEAAHAAGVASVWLSHGQVRRFTAAPTREVARLDMVFDLLHDLHVR